MKNVFPAVLAVVISVSPAFSQQAPSAYEGGAFVYPRSMHGSALASGETFRHDRLTAGHPTIPVGTVVRVTNLTNRLSIDVLVNDRWTGSSSGIMITESAASMLGMVKGTSPRVRIEPLSHPVARRDNIPSVPLPSRQQAPNSEASQSTSNGLYFLEFATYKNIVQAKLFSKKLTKKGAPAKVVQDLQGRYHVISDGYFTSLEDASKAYHLVNNNVGYTPVIKQI